MPPWGKVLEAEILLEPGGIGLLAYRTNAGYADLPAPDRRHTYDRLAVSAHQVSAALDEGAVLCDDLAVHRKTPLLLNSQGLECTFAARLRASRCVVWGSMQRDRVRAADATVRFVPRSADLLDLLAPQLGEQPRQSPRTTAEPPAMGNEENRRIIYTSATTPVQSSRLEVDLGRACSGQFFEVCEVRYGRSPHRRRQVRCFGGCGVS